MLKTPVIPDFQNIPFSELESLKLRYDNLSKIEEFARRVEEYYNTERTSDTDNSIFKSIMENHLADERKTIRDIFEEVGCKSIADKECDIIAGDLIFTYIKRKN